MKKVILIVIPAVILAVVIAVIATLGAFGYFAYSSLDYTVSAPALAEDGSLVVMSANIRRKEKWWSTSKMDTGNCRWYKRAEYFLKNIEAVKPDIFGSQEVQPGQYEFLTKHLEGYKSVVTYRDDRGWRSESCPIFYSEARFELVESGTYWLSETPDVMSVDWGSGENRIVTYVNLKDKANNDMIIAVYNLHPDWGHPEARIKQLGVAAEKAKASTADKVIVLGDFNSDRNRTDGAAGLALFEEFLQDSTTFPGMTNYGVTYNGYDKDDEDGMMGLDYIFLPADTDVKAVGKVDTVYNGIYPSDHFPIWAKVKF
ncbi:MAG: endonuclease/exonuclease/phosphatase family protein [Clostridia bacterium]|nr:endonuclease/exonuclease/phosphatase family protein [Clostridia bacterium]